MSAAPAWELCCSRCGSCTSACPEPGKPLLWCYQPQLDVLQTRQDVGLWSLALPRARLHLAVPSGTCNKGHFVVSQILRDYLDGRILLGRGKEIEMEVGVLAVLQHWAKNEQQSSTLSRYFCLGVGVCL